MNEFFWLTIGTTTLCVVVAIGVLAHYRLWSWFSIPKYPWQPYASRNSVVRERLPWVLHTLHKNNFKWRMNVSARRLIRRLKAVGAEVAEDMSFSISTKGVSHLQRHCVERGWVTLEELKAHGYQRVRLEEVQGRRPGVIGPNAPSEKGPTVKEVLSTPSERFLLNGKAKAA